MKTAACLLLACFCGAATAGQRSDYAQEWPLRLARDDGGAFRVVLSEAIYRAAHTPDLADIEVFNAAGEPLPATLLGPEGARAQEWPRQMLPVPWFLLPPARTGAATDWNVRTERDTSGRVLRIDATLPGGGSVPVAPELLLDLSQVGTPLAALQLEWPDTASTFQTSVALSGSDDLQHWHHLDSSLLADLRNGDEHLRRDRIAIGGEHRFRYLRLAATSGELPPLSGVRAEAAPPPPEPEWRWLSLDGQADQENGQTFYRYAVAARIPTLQLDVRAGSGNSVASWSVRSRDDEQLPWRMRAGPWTGYRVASGDSVENSSPQFIAGSVRDRYWRVDAAPPPNAPPTLLLGYRPEVLVFLAQGPAPYTVAAGSARARRHDAPIATLLDALRRRHGSDWKPYPAIPETGRTVSGSDALIAAPAPARPPDWRSLLLWVVLVGGTLLVVAMALSLLRPARRAEPDEPGEPPGDE